MPACAFARIGEGDMSEPEIRSSQDVTVPDDAPDALPPVLPPEREGAIDRFLTWIEEQPLFAGAAICFALLVIHILVLNLAGTASGIFIGGQFFAAVGTNAIEIFVLAFIAYNFVLPTLVGASCVRTYDDLRPALMIDDRTFGQTRAGLVDAFPVWRASFGGFCAVVLTTVYGPLLQRLIPGEIGAASLPTIWLYIRLALTFGLLGSSIAYVAMLHHRFRAATGTQLRIELFDLAPVQPIAHYARHVALCLAVLLALAGPAVSQSDAVYASAAILAVGAVLASGAVIGAMWGAHRSIRAAKKAATSELQLYARELWRRAYAGGHLREAVSIPALSAMLNVRNEIVRVADWPGGLAVFARVAMLAIIPILTWFGGQLLSQLSAAFAP